MIDTPVSEVSDARDGGPALAREQPARVLFLHPSDELYGSDLALLNLLRGLDRSRFSPLVVLANDVPYDGVLSRELAASGIECRHLPIAVARRKYLAPAGLPGFLARVLSSTHLVSTLIEDERIALVHTNTLAVWVGGLAARRTGRPHIWHVQEQVERPALLLRFLQRFVPAHATHVVGVSQAALDSVLVTPTARAKSSVIYNAVAPDAWISASGRERIRAELGCAPDDVLVGMVARVSRLKGTDLCVRAISQLLARNPRVRCFVAGGPVPGQTEVLDEVKQLVAGSPAPDRIRLLGLRRDTPDLMAAMDLLVAPSRGGEGSSLTIIQAMFAGKPVVATDVGGNKELVANGATGLLVPNGDVAALADALGQLADDAGARAAMGSAARARAQAMFTVDRQVSSFNHLLEATYREAKHAASVRGAARS